MKAQNARCLNPRIAHVIRIADPRHGFTLDVAALLDIGVDVRRHLARVVFVGQTINHRYARMRGKTLNDFLSKGTNHHDVGHTRDHLCRILNGFATSELGIASVEENRVTAQLMHARLE